jgi:hypothetical protein
MGPPAHEVLRGNDEARHAREEGRTKDADPSPAEPETSWPCANCHTSVSGTIRCPTCHGVQVRILSAVTPLDEATRWVARLSPALQRKGTRTAEAAPVDEHDEGLFRPVDPVGCILAAAPSPLVVEETKPGTLQTSTAASWLPPVLAEIEDSLRRKRRLILTAAAPKKAKMLSAV